MRALERRQPHPAHAWPITARASRKATARVVERFVRLEQSRSQPGSGLGLSLASAVAHLHGGELTPRGQSPRAEKRACLPRGGPLHRSRMTAHRGKRKRLQMTASGATRRPPASRWPIALHGAAARTRRAPRRRVSPNGWRRSPKLRPKPLQALLGRQCQSSRRCSQSRRRLAVSLGAGEPRAGAPAACAAIRSGRASCRAARRHGRCHGRNRRRGRGDAAAPPHEGGGGAADRARRYRRRLAGDAGDARADRARRYRGRRRGAVSARRCRRARAARRRATRRSREDGSGYIVLAMGKMGAFELNYSSDIDLIVFYDPDAPALVPQESKPRRSSSASPAAGEASAGAHRRRLRVPRRSAAAARSGLDPDRGLDRRRAQLLREHRPELGARGDDQGARLRRRHRGRRSDPRRARALHLAQISRLRRGRRHRTR